MDTPQTPNLSIEDALRYGVEQSLKHLTFFTPVLLVIIIIAIYFGHGPSFHSSSLSPSMGAIFFSTSLQALINTLIGMGLVAATLRIIDGFNPTWNDLLVNDKVVLRYILASILYGIMVMVGFFFFILPGVYLVLSLGLFRYAIIDRNAGIEESFHLSADMTRGNKLKLAIFYAVLGFLNLLGLLCFGIGLFVTLPATLIAEVHVYRQLASQLNTPGQSTNAA